MRTLSTIAFVAVLTSTTLACSSSSNSGTKHVAIDAQAFCNTDVNKCGDTSIGTIDECVTNVGLLRFTQACAVLIAKATCDDFKSEDTNLETTCFPPCSNPGLYTCNADGTISQCSETSSTGDNDGGTSNGTNTTRTLTIDCAAGCQGEGSTYTGTCGTSYQGQTADHAQCWCD